MGAGVPAGKETQNILLDRKLCGSHPSLFTGGAPVAFVRLPEGCFQVCPRGKMAHVQSGVAYGACMAIASRCHKHGTDATVASYTVGRERVNFYMYQRVCNEITQVGKLGLIPVGQEGSWYCPGLFAYGGMSGRCSTSRLMANFQNLSMFALVFAALLPRGPCLCNCFRLLLSSCHSDAYTACSATETMNHISPCLY